jgi:hypothetical protein
MNPDTSHSDPAASRRETFARLCEELPPAVANTPDLRAKRDEEAMDAVVALHPDNAFEVRLAVRIVALDAHAGDSLRSAGLAVNDLMEVRRCRAQAASMARQADAVLRSLLRIQAIREKQLAAQADYIPWPKIIGMRNVLVHGYFEIDTDIVWQAVTHDVPALRARAGISESSGAWSAATCCHPRESGDPAGGWVPAFAGMTAEGVALPSTDAVVSSQALRPQVRRLLDDMDH